MWKLYFKPAIERSRKDKGKGRRRARGGGKDRLPSREEYILVGRKFGGTAEDLGREYDRVMGGGDAGESR